MRKSISLLIMLLLCSMVTACSDDEELKGVSVEFKLLNESGEETTVFTEGENIIFKLAIQNDNTEKVKLPALFDIAGTEIFHVYSSDGKDFGKPWDSIGTDNRPFFVIDSKSSFIFTCPWLINNDLEEDPHYYSNYFLKEKTREPLPKGEYYSKFTINLGHGKKKTCKQTFKVE